MITVVIPTIGRPTLRATLAALGPAVPVIVVDDRPEPAGRVTPEPWVRVVPSGGRGPAAARNAGWRAAATPWVVFLDDDVVPEPGWREALLADLADLPGDVAGSQGRIVVPLPSGRRPTDAERNTAGLAGACWITADMAYRRAALESAGGFDERFPRAYREDADLALRMMGAGYRLVRGGRVTVHPVRDEGFWASVRVQRGNADDALMRRLYGPEWRDAIGGVPTRLRRHALVTGLGLGGAVLAGAWLVGASRTDAVRTEPERTGVAGTGAARTGAGRALPVLALAAVAGWGALSAEFAWARLRPGPRTAGEVVRMLVTSVVIPPVACAHRLRGEWRVRR